MEYNLVEVWLRKDPVRWVAGVLAGLFAGAVAMAVAMAISVHYQFEPTFPLQLVGTIALGPSATEIGNMSGTIAGSVILGCLCSFLGFIFAHFTGTNAVGSLLAMGLVWGTFSWIFIWNLFMQSFRPIFAARIPSGPVFPICIAFGLALASVSVFDRVMRPSGGKKR